MVFANAITKADRLVELQYIFWRNPSRVLSTAELARRLGVATRTVLKDIVELSVAGRLPVVYERRGWRLADDARLETLPVRFQLEEAAALYLAGRLLAATADEPNRAVRDALARLACVLPREVRPFVDRIAAARDGADAAFASVFRAIAHGWALQRVVRLSYHPRSHPEQLLECVISPYLIEASAIGRALYVIGRAQPPGALRVFKLERIRSATLTNATFVPPPPAGLLDRLDTAWGVWLSDEEPTRVVLRFDRAVADRVRETRWHPSQRFVALAAAGGGLEMELRVASTIEVIPWLLGWGSHCEVLQPAELRDRIASELSRAADRYTAHSVRGL